MSITQKVKACLQIEIGVAVIGGYNGTILGALIMSVLNSMLTFSNVGPAIQQVVYGSIVLLLAWGYASLTRRV